MSLIQYRDKVIIWRRMLITFSILLILFFALVGRLCYIMIAKSKLYNKYAIEQWTSDVKIAAQRGRILDRNGRELAVSANVYRVDLDLNAIRQITDVKKTATKDELADKISKAVNVKKEDVLKAFDKKLSNGLPCGSANLIRRVQKSDADKLSGLNISGVIVSPDTERYYPNNNFLSHVIGHTNSDGDGLMGIEYIYNKELSGTPGRRIAEINGRNQLQEDNAISEYSKPIPGKDVVLTIDSMIQSFCEKAASEALNDNKAKAVTIIVSDPNNGEILGMVNKPDYNLNDPWIEGKSFNELQKIWRNRAVSDTFEPGSIFKVVTASAAMEEGLVKDTDRFVCNGSLAVDKRQIHCWKRTGHGEQNFQDILKNSCNVGFMMLGQRLGADKLNKYINLFGFGQKTGIDLNGEASGIVKKTKNITFTDLNTMAFGQVNTISCVQYITALNAIANGGKWIRPHLMKEIVHYDDKNVKHVDQEYNNYGTKTILDANTMSQLRSYLEKVISEGGGKKAYVDGYTIAGKTGTAQKPVDGRYAAGKYVASFGGMAPADKPKITVMVSIDEPDPSNYYAGQIAAPVAGKMFNDIFNYLNMAPSSASDVKDVMIPEIRGIKKSEAAKILKELNLDYQADNAGDYVTGMTPLPGAMVKEGSKIILYTGQSPTYNKMVVVPDFTGYSKDDAKKAVESLGLKVNFLGSGVVTDQDIEVGKQVESGSTITLQLDDDDVD